MFKLISSTSYCLLFSFPSIIHQHAIANKQASKPSGTPPLPNPPAFFPPLEIKQPQNNRSHGAQTDMSTTAMPLPIFRDQGTNSFPTIQFTAAFATTTSPSTTSNYSSNSSPYRPTVASPLSSSPIRVSSPMTTPPLSPRDLNARAIQSSPIFAASKQDPYPSPVIFGSGGGSSSTSRFASRPTRPTPLNLKREAAQESRRKLFLKNVRQRAEDKRWEMRGGEQEVSTNNQTNYSLVSFYFLYVVFPGTSWLTAGPIKKATQTRMVLSEPRAPLRQKLGLRRTLA